MAPPYATESNIPLLGGLDIVHHLIHFLEVVDVVMLMMTSKLFFGWIYNSRCAWLKLVDALISHEGIPPYSFNTQSMTTEELRLCATRSLRLRHALAGNHGARLTVICKFQYPRRGPILFFPGGRYFVSMSTGDGDGSIEIWDIQKVLGQTADPVARFHPGHSNTPHSRLGFSYQYHPDEQRLVLLYCYHSNHDVIYRILFIDWQSHEPSIVSGPHLRMDELFELDQSEAMPQAHSLEREIVCICDYIPTPQMSLPYHGTILSGQICLFPQMVRWFAKIDIPALRPVPDGPYPVEYMQHVRLWTGGNPPTLLPGRLNLHHQDPWCRRVFRHLVINVGGDEEVHGPHIEIEISGFFPNGARTRLISQVHSSYPFGIAGGFRKHCSNVNGCAAIEAVSYNTPNDALVSTATVKQWVTDYEVGDQSQVHLLAAPCKVSGHALLRQAQAIGSDELILVHFE
ncbi:uncharacterized protein EI90DRAFT_675762 [Cantharellus anzutake]|uniref:uncharacterized protein n=1 Tax=Cantharellus anzutake TaxID=1750568 RepID=UPI001903BBD5|nr:uncharacterized protein EI90DRAFT_675762 [Cantharellus anzutake]KAF8332617.1 hypothetical protein EI90DRAFT_675762 [Cantharellus anzutake]